MEVINLVIADFNIICLGQKYKKICELDGIRTDVVKASEISKLYGNKWSVLSAYQGYLYSVYPIDDMQDYDYSNGFFDLDIRDSMKYVIHGEQSFNKIVGVLNHYIEASPIKTVCILVRLDWDNENKIIGTIDKRQFLEKLQSREIMFNTAYIVSK